MSVIQACYDIKDVLDFFKPLGLYLKPLSRLNISVQLPQLKKSGAKISNWEVMERVKEMAKPFNFPVFKIAKSSLEFIRFEAEIENYGSMEQVLAKLDMKTIKLSGFHELLKVRAAEAKVPFPTREDWDSFFRNNKNMNEMKAGERPDTIHVQNLPTKWFVDDQDRSGAAKDRPSEHVLKKVFRSFGEIRAVDIPMLDPYREKMKSSISGIRTFSFGQDLVFDAFIQYQEYIGFVKAMNSLKGMKLLHKDRYEERSWVANIKVDFDKTKHLSEATIKKRTEEREKLVETEREREDAERKKRELEELKRSDTRRKMQEEAKVKEKVGLEAKKTKEQRRLEREQRRRERKRKKTLGNEDAIAHKIAIEERKLLVAQRKLESIRLLDELLERVKAVKSKGSLQSIEDDLLKTAAKEAKGLGKAASMLSHSVKDQDEKLLRDKLVCRLKEKEVEKMKHFDDKIQKVRKKGLERTSSFSSSDNKQSSGENFSTDNDVEHQEKFQNDRSPFSDISDLSLTSFSDEDELERKQLKDEKKSRKDFKKKKRKTRRNDDLNGDSSPNSDKDCRRRHKNEKKDAEKKRKEIERHISLAKIISSRDNRSKSKSPSRTRSRHRSRSPRGERNQDYKRTVCRAVIKRSDRKEGKSRWEDPSPALPEYTKRYMLPPTQAVKMLAKQQELAKEELYDKMMYPHLYGDHGSSHRPGYYRKPKRDEHYEEIQRRELEQQLRMRERMEVERREREKLLSRESESRSHHRHRSHSDHRPDRSSRERDRHRRFK